MSVSETEYHDIIAACVRLWEDGLTVDEIFLAADGPVRDIANRADLDTLYSAVLTTLAARNLNLFSFGNAARKSTH